MRLKLQITGLLLWVLVAGVAQDFHHTLRNYTVADGLPQSQVVGITEDSHGYLWIGTQGGGLARFDGREFKAYNALDGLISSEIEGLQIDTHENIWTLHATGVTRFDGVTFKKFHFKEQHKFKRILLHGDTLFAISWQGKLAALYDDSVHAEQSVIPDRTIVRIHIIGRDKNIFFLDDESIIIQTSNKRRHVRPTQSMGRIYGCFNYEGNVVVQAEKGTFLVDYSKASIVAYNLGFPLTNRVMLYDARQHLFWTYFGPRLLKESFENGKHKCDTVLRDITTERVYIDSENNTWFGTDGNGLYKYFIQDFDKCPSDRLRGVMSIAKGSDGTTWIGTMTGGLWKINHGKFRSYFDKAMPSMPYRNSINCVEVDDHGAVYIASRGGVGKYNEKKDAFQWIPSMDGDEFYFTRCLAADEKSGLWAVTSAGLTYYDGIKWQKKYTTDQGLSNNFPWTLCYARKSKRLYLGMENSIQYLENDHVSTIPINGIESTAVITIANYHDSLLVAGTGGAGLLIVNPDTKNVTHLSTRDGLASDFVYFAAPDDKNYIWVGTEKGINRIRLNASHEIVENLHYGYDNGLTGVETNQNAYYISPTEKFFGLVDGVYEFNDLKQPKGKTFNLHLTGVEILYGEYSARSYADSLMGFFKIPYHLELPPDRNHVTFHFNRVDKRHPKSIKFKYFLENFDKAWSQPGTMGQATYGNLPPGDYVFRVMATDSEGSWNSNAIAYTFTIKSPFYMQASFIVGTIICLAGLITLILYLRVQQRIRNAVLTERIRTQEQESLRKEIARDFHDEMGNQLTRIINYVSLLKLNGKSGYDHQDLYNKVEHSAKYLYSGTRDFIWAIDPINDELTKLFIHLRDFGVKLFEEKGIPFRAHNQINRKVKLPYGFSREANLIFKEAMTNAFKYSNAANITFSLLKENDSFVMMLADDGIGFYAGDVQKLNGLKNIRERADKIKAVLRISSEPGRGTKISLHFTLNQTPAYGHAL